MSKYTNEIRYLVGRYGSAKNALLAVERQAKHDYPHEPLPAHTVGLMQELSGSTGDLFDDSDILKTCDLFA